MRTPKKEFLAKEGLLNPKPERVGEALFRSHPFFDPLDLLQIRYEMLRLARVEEVSVAEASRRFGFSRESFYQREREFMARGVAGLLGAPRGRTPLLARNQEIVKFIVQRKLTDSELTGEQLRKEIRASFGVDCSRRTVERVVEKLQAGKRGLLTF